MRRKKTIALVLLFHLAHFAPAQNFSPGMRKQLQAIDTIKSDSAALLRLEALSTTESLTTEERLRTNARIIVRTNALQQFATSMRLCTEGIEMARANGLDSLECTFNSLAGVTNYYMERKREAIDYFKEAIRVARKINYWEKEAMCSHNIGGALVDLKDFKNAEYYLTNAIQIWSAHGYEHTHDYLLSNRVLATLYEGTNRSAQAEEIYRNLVGIAKQMNDTALLASNLLFYAGLLNRKGEHDEAITMTGEAVSYLRTGNDFHGLIAALSFYGNYLANAGRYKEAFENIREAQLMQRKTFATDLEKQISEIEVKYKTAEKENQINLQQVAIQKQKTMMVLISILFLLVVFTGVLLFNRHRLKAKQLLQEEMLKQERLRNQSMIMAQENERKHIAGELHDGLGQVLSAARLNVESLSMKAGNEADPHFHKALDLLDNSFNELRNISHRMMPVQLIRFGLDAAIKDMTGDMNKSETIRFHFDSDEKIPRFESNIEINVFRIVQEWISNILKYAAASVVSIQLTLSEDGLTVMIEDNGKGFDPRLLETGKGNGWYNINSRLNLINGQIEIDSKTGMGTLVSVFVPVTVMNPALN